MPNLIKYNTSTESESLRKGNFYIGVGDVPKGLTSESGFWTGYDVPSGGYVVYLNKESSGPSIYTASSDSDLVSLINRITNSSFTTIGESLVWASSQTGVMVVNKQYPSIITDGLVINLDCGFTPSYPTTGLSWYDTSTRANNSTLVNGTNYVPETQAMSFDGTDDYVSIPHTTALTDEIFSQTRFSTLESTVNVAVFQNWTCMINQAFGASYSNTTGPGLWSNLTGYQFVVGTGVNSNPTGGSQIISFTATANRWYHIVGTINGTDMRMYVNGNLHSAVTTNINTIQSNNQPVVIGRRSTGSAPSLNGEIASVRAYNRPLSLEEVRQNYYQGPIVTDNISGMYSASNIVSFEPGSTAAYYMVGTESNLEGVLQNGVGYNSGFGGYWSFDGVDDRILLKGSTTNAWRLNANTNWTVSAWIRTSTTVGNSLGAGPIFSNSSGGPVYSVMCVNNGKATYWHYNGSWLRKSGAIKVNDGKWHMITWVNKSNSTMDIYVDNNLDLSNVSSALSSNNNLDIIGGSWAGAFAGDIASIQINNGKSFSQSEVIQNFFAYQSKFGYSPSLTTEGLVLHLDALNPDSYSSGNTWFDLSGNGNNATRNGQTGNPSWDSTNGWYFPASVTGVNGGFTISNSSSLENLSTITVFLVLSMQTKTLGDSQWMAMYSKFGADQRIAISVNQTPNSTFRYLHIETPASTNSAANLFTDSDYTGSKYNIIAARVSSSGTTGWLNGNNVSSSAGTTTGNNGTLYLGLDNNDEMFRGYMKCVLTYNRDLNDTEMSNVFRYLNSTYSVY